MAWTPEPNNRPDANVAETPPPQPGSTGEEWADLLARFVSDARTDERVAERRRRHWLQREAVESSSFAGLLCNLAERVATVRLLTAAGGTHIGVLTAVGADVVVLKTTSGRAVLVAIAHLVAVQHYGTDPLDGDRGNAAGGPSLRHLLAELADVDAELSCTLAGGTVMSGRLIWVGEDLFALDPTDSHSNGPQGPLTDGYRYVRLLSLIDVSPRVSG